MFRYPFAVLLLGVMLRELVGCSAVGQGTPIVPNHHIAVAGVDSLILH